MTKNHKKIGLTIYFSDEVELLHWINEEGNFHPLAEVRKATDKDEPKKKYVLTFQEQTFSADLRRKR